MVLYKVETYHGRYHDRYLCVLSTGFRNHWGNGDSTLSRLLGYGFRKCANCLFDTPDPNQGFRDFRQRSLVMGLVVNRESD